MCPELDRLNQLHKTVKGLLDLYLAINMRGEIAPLVHAGFGFGLNDTKTEVLWVKPWDELDDEDHRKARPGTSLIYTVRPLANSSRHDPAIPPHPDEGYYRTSRSSR